jgi:hypothetical protein
MSQHDYDIANQSSAAFRSDLNLALKALASLSSGTAAPSTTYANMLWYETDTNILKMRNEADDAWISLFYLDQTNGDFHILDDTHVVDTSGTQTGLLGDQATSAWTTGTGTTESLVSPAKVKAAIDQFAPANVGVSQTWQDVSGSRTAGTAYQNTTGKAIDVAVQLGTGTTYLQVSSDGTTYLSIANGNTTSTVPASVIVPDDHYYKVVGSFTRWHELR